MGASFNLAGFSMPKFGLEDHDDEPQHQNETLRNNDTQRSNETEPESQHIISPAVNVNVPEEVLVRSRVNMYGSVTTGTTFAWTQIEGPDVVLSATNTLSPSFTAPSTSAVLVFELTASNSSGASTTIYSTVKVIADEVKISHVTWVKPAGKGKEKGKGKLNVVAFSSAVSADTLPPLGMTMTAKVWSKAIPAGHVGSAAKPLEMPMKLVKDVVGQSPICASDIPCFSLAVDGIIDPRSSSNAPQFVQPTAIVVESFLGGSSIAKDAAIRVR
jgi:hypothetical protein